MKIPQKTSAGLPHVNFSSTNLHPPPILITFQTSSQITAAFKIYDKAKNSTNTVRNKKQCPKIQIKN